ncbi:hypothetical protein HZS_6017, partial [Henneguya salminicola]
KWETFVRRYWQGDIHGEQHKIIIWGTNETLSLMIYNTYTFIGGTFRSAHQPLYQCIIVMVYDIGTEIYVPTVYALVTCKNENIYSEVFPQIVVLMGVQLDAVYHYYRFRKSINIVNQTRISREQNSLVLFSLETSHHKEKGKGYRNFGHTFEKHSLSDSTLLFGMSARLKGSKELTLRLNDTVGVSMKNFQTRIQIFMHS